MIARQRHLGVGIALLMGALVGCAAGQVTQTADQESAVNGASGQVGPIAVRDAVFVYPSGDEHFYAAGSAAALTLTIVNTEGTEDRLVAVQSPVGQARLDGSTTIPGRSAVRAIAIDVTETTTSAATTVATTSATTSAPTSGPVATTTVSAPTSGPATTSGPAATSEATTSGPATSSEPSATTSSASDLAPGELTIVLEKLTEDIRPGRTVLVVLLFEKAGELQLLVPIASPDEPRGESAH